MIEKNLIDYPAKVIKLVSMLGLIDIGVVQALANLVAIAVGLIAILAPPVKQIVEYIKNKS